MSLASLYVTTPSREEAERIGKKLLEERLVACVNIFDGVTSLFWWEGALQEEQEVAFVAKTQMRLVNEAIKLVQELHPYDVPCIAVTPVLKANLDYMRWVEAETKTDALP